MTNFDMFILLVDIAACLAVIQWLVQFLRRRQRKAQRSAKPVTYDDLTPVQRMFMLCVAQWHRDGRTGSFAVLEKIANDPGYTSTQSWTTLEELRLAGLVRYSFGNAMAEPLTRLNVMLTPSGVELLRQVLPAGAVPDLAQIKPEPGQVSPQP